MPRPRLEENVADRIARAEPQPTPPTVCLRIGSLRAAGDFLMVEAARWRRERSPDRGLARAPPSSASSRPPDYLQRDGSRDRSYHGVQGITTSEKRKTVTLATSYRRGLPGWGYQRRYACRLDSLRDGGSSAKRRARRRNIGDVTSDFISHRTRLSLGLVPAARGRAHSGAPSTPDLRSGRLDFMRTQPLILPPRASLVLPS